MPEPENKETELTTLEDLRAALSGDGGEGVDEPTPQTPTDEDLRGVVREILQEETEEGREEPAPEMASEEEQDRGWEAAEERALHRRSLDDLNHAEREDLGNMLYRLIHGQARRRETQVAEAVRDLTQAGYYGPEAREALETGDTRSLSTLTDTDGGVFLPETVMNEILRVVPDFGVIRRLGRQVPVGAGSVKVPNVTAGLTAFWVGEGQEIKARKAAFGSKKLDPEKMGVIVPWTSELEEETGAAFLELIMELIAEAFAELEDESGLYGDGSAAYGGVTGIANAAGVSEIVLADNSGSGGTNGSLVSHVTASDLLALKYQVKSSVRGRGRFVVSSDLLHPLYDLKDDNGNYIIKRPTESGELPRIWNSPIEFTDAAIGPNATTATQNDAAFAFFGDFSRFLLGQQRGMTSKLMTEATITDVDDATDIRLGAQDMQAIRMTQRVDMLIALADAFARLKTQVAPV